MKTTFITDIHTAPAFRLVQGSMKPVLNPFHATPDHKTIAQCRSAGHGWQAMIHTVKHTLGAEPGEMDSI